MRNFRWTLSTLLLAVAADGLALPALRAQCSQRQRQNWTASSPGVDDVALKRSFVFVNPEPYDIRICDIAVQSANGGCSSARMRIEVYPDANGGVPDGSPSARSALLTIPGSFGTVRGTYSNLTLAAGARYQVVLDYGTTNGCGFPVRRFIQKPVAGTGTRVESYAFVEQSSVRFWLRDDQPVRYEINYRPSVRGSSVAFGSSCGVSAPCSNTAFRSINWNGNPLSGSLLRGARRAFRVADNFGYPTRDVCSLEIRSGSVGSRPATLAVAIHQEDDRLPGQELVRTTVAVPPGAPRAIRVTFPVPARIGAGRNYWVGLEPLNGGVVILPIERIGNPVADATWNGTRWIAGPGGDAYSVRIFRTTTLTRRSTYTATTPVLGRTQSMRLSGAPARAPAILLLGLTNPDFDLGALGANGCRLLSSAELTVNTTTNSAGGATVSLPVPTNTSLLSGRYFGQFAVTSTVNGLGLELSNGARCKVGSF